MNIKVFALRICFLLALIIPMMQQQAGAQEFGEVVIKRGTIDDDLYLAGAQVDVYATVNGDVVVAGGQLNIEGEISADVMAAGGTITVRGTVADDARLAGGDLRVAGRVGDDLVAAGGRIHLGPAAQISGRAWLSGGDIRVDGRVGKELRVSGGRVVISGKVDGNVNLWAEQITIEEGAEIAGNLHYRSHRQAIIHNGARIGGEVVHTPVDVDLKPVAAAALLASLLILTSIIVTAVVLYLLFTDFSTAVARLLRDQPGLSLLVGLAVFAGAPVLAVILFSSFIGIWLGLLLLVLYLVLLVTGYFIGALSLGDAGLKAMHKNDAGKALHATAMVVALFILALINMLPLLGGLINLLVLLAGTGAISRKLYLLYRS